MLCLTNPIFCIFLEAPSVVLNMSDTIVTTWMRHQVSLGCYATGHSTITYSWAKDGHFVDGKQTKACGSLLFITPSAEEDFGTYTCTASNKDGIATHNVTLMQIQNPAIQGK